MHIRELHLRNVMNHADTRIEIPAVGVVTVVGPNGAGKSSVIEAASVAFWGKTLRGSSPWGGPDALVMGRAFVGDDVIEVTRRREKGKVTLSWRMNTDDPVEYETPTKAQEALERVIGPWDVWRRSETFSASDAAAFTGATDAQRQRFLEGIIGIDSFDAAGKTCRKDLKEASERAVRIDRELAVARTRLSELGRRIASLSTIEVEGPTDAPSAAEVRALEAERDRLAALVKTSEKEIASFRDQIRSADRAGADHAATARQIQALLAKLSKENCPTCGQLVPKALKKKLTADATKAENEAKHAQEHARNALATIEEELADLQDEHAALVKKVRDASEKATEARLKVATARQRGDRAAQVAEQLALAEKEAKAAHEDVERLLIASSEARVAVGELEAAADVLGLEGVRVQLVARALGGLEGVINAWLARVSDNIRIRLTPYTKTKSGGVNDEIGLDVVGVANGEGYEGSSSGERRRLDGAIVLGLGEFTASAHGRTPGTLFCDEVFDGLDEEGMHRMGAVLREIAEYRAIVVITHRGEVLRALNAVRHVVVSEGAIVQAA